MSSQILINIAVAMIWMLLWNSYTFVDFTIGFFVGVGILFLLNRFLRYDFYFLRVIAFIKLLLIFIRELIKSNIDLAKIILSPKMDIQPGIVAVPTKLKSDWEITLLATLISLTPGTISMSFAEDSTTIFVHFIDVPNKEEAIKNIKTTFEDAIMEVTD